MQFEPWGYTLDLTDFWRADLPWFKKRDILVGRIEAQPWYDENDYELVDILFDIANVESVQQFDRDWDKFYDYADDNRIWVKTF